MQMSGGLYDTAVKGKSAEEILATANLGTSDPAGYLNVAAQVRSNEELIAALSKASTDSANIANRIFWLTLVLAIAAFLQAIATAWPYLAWWWQHRPINSN